MGRQSGSKRVFHRHRATRREVQDPQGERGIAILELSLVMLMLFTFTAAIYDYGQGWRSGLMVSEATRAAARVGSALGPRYGPGDLVPADAELAVVSGRSADYQALSSAKASLASSNKLESVTRVVIFRAGPSGTMPSICRTSTSEGCNVIEGDAFRTNWDDQGVMAATNQWGCVTIGSCGWRPTQRGTDQDSAEYFGVWIEVEHDFMFPITGDLIDVSRTTVMRLEPKVR